MKLADISVLYDKGLKKLYSERLLKLNEYIDFLSRGNIYALKFENQVLAYTQNSKAEYLRNYAAWSRDNCVPFPGTAIHLFPRDNHAWFLFDIKNTVSKGNPYMVPIYTEEDILSLYSLMKGNDKICVEKYVNLLTQTYVHGNIVPKLPKLMSFSPEFIQSVSDCSSEIILRSLGVINAVSGDYKSLENVTLKQFEFFYPVQEKLRDVFSPISITSEWKEKTLKQVEKGS